MIELATDAGVLARFVRDLHADSGADELLAECTVPCDHDDREVAALAWASRIVDEYRSVAVFGELLILLAELEAPYRALCAVQHLIGDELRHARLCAGVVSWLGGGIDVDLTDLALPPPAAGETRGHRAALIVARELVVAEEESITVLAACRDATTAAVPRAVLSSLLRDEVRHAATGRAVLRLFDPGGPLAHALTTDERAALPAVIAADRAALRAVYRDAARGGVGRALGASITAADLEAAAATRVT